MKNLESPLSSNVEAFLGPGSKVNGKLKFEGTVEINGKVEGEINAAGKLIIGETASIDAKIMAAEVIVRGTVTGDIEASKSLCLERTARMSGNLMSKQLKIEEGATFEGTCAMSDTSAQQAPRLKSV